MVTKHELIRVSFEGASNQLYNFIAHPLNYKFAPIGAVYFITNRYQKTNGNYSHAYIYVGETNNLSERFDSYHQKECFKKHNANCICIYPEESEQTRLKIEKDLKDNYDPPCND